MPRLREFNVSLVLYLFTHCSYKGIRYWFEFRHYDCKYFTYFRNLKYLSIKILLGAHYCDQYLLWIKAQISFNVFIVTFSSERLIYILNAEQTLVLFGKPNDVLMKAHLVL